MITRVYTGFSEIGERYIVAVSKDNLLEDSPTHAAYRIYYDEDFGLNLAIDSADHFKENELPAEFDSHLTSFLMEVEMLHPFLVPPHKNPENVPLCDFVEGIQFNDPIQHIDPTWLTLTGAVERGVGDDKPDWADSIYVPGQFVCTTPEEYFGNNLGHFISTVPYILFGSSAFQGPDSAGMLESMEGVVLDYWIDIEEALEPHATVPDFRHHRFMMVDAPSPFIEAIFFWATAIEACTEPHQIPVMGQPQWDLLEDAIAPEDRTPLPAIENAIEAFSKKIFGDASGNN
jgi:hypothetical protein